MNIIRREFKANFKSFLIWSGALFVIFFAASTEFEAYYNNDEIVEAMATFEALFQALGVEISNMTTPKGFLALVSVYIYLPLSIYAGLLGSNIISKEEKDKTAEFLFTMPVSRTKVLVSKFLVALTYILLIDLVAVGVNILAYARFDLDRDFFEFTIYLTLGVFLTELIFLSLGFLLASVLNQYKLSGGIMIGFLMASFMVSMLIGFVEEADFLKYLTPFQYFPADKMMKGSFDLIFLFLTFLVSASSIGGLFYFFKKRDLFI